MIERENDFSNQKKGECKMKRFTVLAAVIFAILFLAGAACASGIELKRGADDPLEDLPPSRLSEDYLLKDELATTSKATLAYLRNRLYANHGYIFKSKKWRGEFSHFDWYEPNPNFSYKLFNKFERENIRRILAAEKSK
jgi:hypothetical protein